MQFIGGSEGLPGSVLRSDSPAGRGLGIICATKVEWGTVGWKTSSLIPVLALKLFLKLFSMAIDLFC